MKSQSLLYPSFSKSLNACSSICSLTWASNFGWCCAIGRNLYFFRGSCLLILRFLTGFAFLAGVRICKVRKSVSGHCTHYLEIWLEHLNTFVFIIFFVFCWSWLIRFALLIYRFDFWLSAGSPVWVNTGDRRLINFLFLRTINIASFI